jgi:predicted 3-demethylubiquinone-9 3-methyltransferase (glyoxalase superfamily)
MTISGVTTFLWFNTEAEEAAKFYVSTFPNSRIISTSYYLENAQMPAGTALTVEFELFGIPFAALNGGPHLTHSEAVSFQVHCDTQAEIDQLWKVITSDGGEESNCGWCKDRFGVSWQIIPRELPRLLSHSDPAIAHRAFTAMMQMQKIVIAELA